MPGTAADLPTFLPFRSPTYSRAMAFKCPQQNHQRHTHGVLRTSDGVQRLPRVSSRATVSSKQAQPVIEELLQLVAGTDRGLNTPEQLQKSILANIEQLKAAQAGKQTTDAALLSATWKVRAGLPHTSPGIFGLFGRCLDMTLTAQVAWALAVQTVLALPLLCQHHPSKRPIEAAGA
jgi:hypothetical protein